MTIRESIRPFKYRRRKLSPIQQQAIEAAKRNGGEVSFGSDFEFPITTMNALLRRGLICITYFDYNHEYIPHRGWCAYPYYDCKLAGSQF